MPRGRLFPEDGFIRRYRVIRRIAALGGTLVGIYFLGAMQGWWDRFLF